MSSFWMLSVLAAGLALADSDHSAKEKITILAFGDAGTGSSDQYQVAAGMKKACDEVGCDFALMLGDNIYECGVKNVDSPKFAERFEKPYEAFVGFEFWGVLGNHDVRKKASAQIEYTMLSDRWRMPYRFYPVPRLPSWIHLFGLDTNEMDRNQLIVAERQMCAREGWKIFFGHAPVYSNGEHGNSKKLEKELVPVIEKCGVHFYLSGHDHDQEHLTGARFEQVVQGAGAKLRDVAQVPWGAGQKAKQRFARSALGFSVLELTPERAAMSFRDSEGSEIYRWEGGKADIGLDVATQAPLARASR